MPSGSDLHNDMLTDSNRWWSDTEQMINPDSLEALAHRNVKKIGRREGQTAQIGPLRFTWKARGEDTGYEFSVFEFPLAPGVAIPLHKHPSAEMIYVLEGEASFARLLPDGSQEWLTCTAGECVLAPGNVPHGEANRSDKPARVLSISTYYHEMPFREAASEVSIDDPLPAFDPSVFMRFEEIAARYQGYTLQPAEKE